MRREARIASILLASFLLSACAVPAGLQVASWAIGGISYATTQKSLTDHGISVVVGRDCSMTKVLTDGTLCADDIPPEMQVAQADGVVVKYRHAKLRPHLKKSYQEVSLDLTDPDLGKFSVVPADEAVDPVKAVTPQKEEPVKIVVQLDAEQPRGKEAGISESAVEKSTNEDEPSIEELANFDTAAGGDPTDQLLPEKVSQPVQIASLKEDTPESNELVQHSLKPANETQDEDLVQQENRSVSEEPENAETKDGPGIFEAFVSVLFPDTASEDDSAVQNGKTAGEKQQNDPTDPEAVTPDDKGQSTREEAESENSEERSGAPDFEQVPPRLPQEFGSALPAVGPGEERGTLQSDVAPAVLEKSPQTPVNESRFYGLTRPFKFLSGTRVQSQQLSAISLRISFETERGKILKRNRLASRSGAPPPPIRLGQLSQGE